MNRAFTAITQYLQGALLLKVGDQNQAIYGFIGNACNALSKYVDNNVVESLHISKTWRFGSEIAIVANTLLRCVKGKSRMDLIVGCGPPGRILNTEDFVLNELGGSQMAIICRSNIKVLWRSIWMMRINVKVEIICQDLNQYFKPFWQTSAKVERMISSLCCITNDTVEIELSRVRTELLPYFIKCI